MESYEGAGCVDCYREHCRQRTPSVPVTTTASDRRTPSPQMNRCQTAPRRFDFTRRSCRLFIAGSFVIGLILVPCAMSAPAKPSKSQSPTPPHSIVATGTPFWHNPCGTLLTYDGSGGGATGAMMSSAVSHDIMMESEPESESVMRREEDIIHGIVVAAGQALTHAEQFTGAFVVETFHVDVKKNHDHWKGIKLDWLELAKYMPKALDVPLSKSYLASLTFRDVLHAVYIGMQNLAVGLEQVAWDQDREMLPYAKYFNETTLKLRTILCEVSMAIYEINDTPEPHVSRDIMPIESRISRDNQSLRDWLILREYMTSLQYVIEAFGYLKTKR
ncbi:uncharacterized protein LOC100575771 isoform X1 [Acyrthosiphon pisum]|uniref:Uncharacterized protein n=2 Tax=Acyrthosiphon pisum TaxID=7029 RepID=A0A8R2H9S0_ACYPI|nr:uncharacterized protein LOC100575771 isoform X1 [Acyrthosiphon pisum]|eukprot:XP_016664053.1 PREDICTED: uncharacterized protein LOC100575771 isoform X1 [Acyrthosiphon pisum]